MKAYVYPSATDVPGLYDVQTEEGLWQKNLTEYQVNDHARRFGWRLAAWPPGFKAWTDKGAAQKDAEHRGRAWLTDPALYGRPHTR